MINPIVVLLLLVTAVEWGSLGITRSGSTLGISTIAFPDYVSTPSNPETKTNFTQKELIEKTRIPFKTRYVNNKELEAETEKTIQEGKDGEKRTVYALTFWQGKQIDKTLKETGQTDPTDKIVEVGTKFTWKETSFGGTVYRYWKKMNVRATSYDANCKGCLGRTWAGTPVQLGTCAVDPKVIVMGSHFYVPGYGVCSALDIGGAIKGKKIDLGFPDVSKGFWSTRYVDIYLLDGEPKD
jgi:3D (Asp-Asp-Asp) domain-containing protein